MRAIAVHETGGDALVEEGLERAGGEIEPGRVEGGVDPGQRRAVLARQVRSRLGTAEAVLARRKPRPAVGHRESAPVAAVAQ